MINLSRISETASQRSYRGPPQQSRQDPRHICLSGAVSIDPAINDDTDESGPYDPDLATRPPRRSPDFARSGKPVHEIAADRRRLRSAGHILCIRPPSGTSRVVYAAADKLLDVVAICWVGTTKQGFERASVRDGVVDGDSGG